MARWNDGLRKRCRCPRRKWAKCPHPWWFGFTWDGREIRFSLHKVLGKSYDYLMSRSEAERWRDHFKAQIRAGEFIDPTKPPQPSPDQRMTLGDLVDRYLDGHVRVPTRRPGGRQLMEWQIAALRRIEIPVPGGGTCRFESRFVDQITKADVEAIRQEWRIHMPRAKNGEVGCNRLLSRLRHLFNWAIADGYLDRTPFKRHGVTVVKLNGAAETPRHRRLEEGEEERLLAHANSHLHAIIIAALETGCRLGELLAIQWRDVRWGEGIILLPASKTKTNEARAVLVTRRLWAVLETRRHDPAGIEFGPEAYVFGNAVGERAKSIRTAWENCRKRAGVKGLHFHDLRREFASRLLESPGVALHDVAEWVGHSNPLTTTRYLSTTGARRLEVLKRFEEHRALEPTAHRAEPTAHQPPAEAR